MDKETEVWFAMRATYRRELEAMHLLEKANLGCFIPMQYKISIRRGRKVRALVPVIRNLVFVHARPSEVQRFKSQITYLQYITAVSYTHLTLPTILPKCSDLSLKLLICNISPIPVAVRK